MFDLERATNQKALSSLIESYNYGWKGQYTMYKLINLWFYKKTADSKKVIVRGYYAYYFPNGQILYWNAYFVYNVKKNKYCYVIGSGNYADDSWNGLSDCDLKKLRIYYYNPDITPNNYYLEKLAQTTIC